LRGRPPDSRSQRGDDTLVGDNLSSPFSLNTLIGDAKTMSGNTQGGNDTLVGGNDTTASPAGTYDNILVGDAQTMSDSAHGGNDKLISGSGNDDMWGDAQVMLGNAQGGNDMFVFKPNNGHDKIEDFGQGVQGVVGSNWGTDQIDLTALGIQDFSQLTISAFDPTTHESTITLSPGNDVVVHSQVALTARDFLLVQAMASFSPTVSSSVSIPISQDALGHTAQLAAPH
jgi:Ca2+-binding RTX toxin-like protein